MKTLGICVELVVRSIVLLVVTIGTFGLALLLLDMDDFMDVRR